MTTTEFENEWKKRNSGKMIHFISMIEVRTCTSEDSLVPFLSVLNRFYATLEIWFESGTAFPSSVSTRKMRTSHRGII